MELIQNNPNTNKTDLRQYQKIKYISFKYIG